MMSINMHSFLLSFQGSNWPWFQESQPLLQFQVSNLLQLQESQQLPLMLQPQVPQDVPMISITPQDVPQPQIPPQDASIKDDGKKST